jgi:hypothetical protein
MSRWTWILVAVAACGGDSSPASDDTTGNGTSSGGPTTTNESSSSSTSSSGGGVDTTGTGSSSSSSAGPADGSESSTGAAPTDPGCPECTVLADGLESGRGVAIDDTHVYFTDQTAGTVERVAIGGGDHMVLADNQDAAYDVTVADGMVYWTRHSEDGGVVRIAKSGGAPELVDEDATYARAVAVDDTHVYWTRFATNAGSLHRRSVDFDGDPELLYTGSNGFSELALSETRVFVSSHEPYSGGGVGFIEPPPEDNLGTVLSVPLAGDLDDTDTAPVGGDVAQPWGIAIAGDEVYFATGDGGGGYGPNRIFHLTIGSPPAAQLTTAQNSPWGVAADDAWVYFTDASEVKAAAVDDGEITVLATMQNSARSIAVNDTTLVWITKDRVLARPKP